MTSTCLLKWNNSLLKALFLGLILTLSSCRSTYITESFEESKIPIKPNYNEEVNWAILPSKYTESLQKIALNSELKTDVFYIYPTLITGKKDIRWNVPVDDSIQNDKVLNTAVAFQASAWATAGNIYIPYYRQAHLRSYTYLEKGGREALKLAYSDVKEAFETYLKKYNNGKPIIIASHSQGSTHTDMLLKEFFDNKPLQKQLIAAYVIGTGIEKDAYKTIPLMTEPNETGGFVSWNTFKRNNYPKKYNDWYKGKAVTNPITWNSSVKTKREDHKGFLFSNNKLYEKALKLEVIDGMIWTTLPRFPLRLFMIFKKNYHIGDVNLFWKDIQENAEIRVKSWFKINEAN